MKKVLFTILIVFNLSGIHAQSIFKGDGEVSFISEAPLEVIEGQTDELVGIVDVSNMNFAFKVNMSTFDGFNSALQKEHFNEHYLETKKYPDAIFLGTLLVQDDCVNNCETKAVCKGKFTIHGVTQIVSIPVVLKFNDQTLEISGEFKVNLSKYNIKIPKIVQAKIASEILVKVNVVMTKDA